MGDPIPDPTMSQHPRTEQSLARLVAWANERTDIRAVMVVGSRGRRDPPADEWSDLDVLIMATHPGRYLATPEWLHEIDRVWLVCKESTPIGQQEVFLVTFEGGSKVDIIVVSSRTFALAARVLRMVRRFPAAFHIIPRPIREQLTALSDVLNSGVRVVVDKDDIAPYLEAGGLLPVPPQPPTEAEFLETVHHFLNEQVWIGLKLGRGELFLAKTVGESRLMALLRRMLEWHAQANGGLGAAPGQYGRFLEAWADPRAVEQLRAIFPRYHIHEIWRARFASLELFRWLAEETASRLGYTYPHETERRVMAWVRSLAPGDDAPERPQ